MVEISRMTSRNNESAFGGDIGYPEAEKEVIPLEEFILVRRGFSNLEDAVNYGFEDKEDLNEDKSFSYGVPLWIARQIVIIDQIDTSATNKEKIFAYKLWEEKGSFDLVKDYLPEQVLSLEDLQSSLSSQNKKKTRSREKISKMLHDVLVEEDTLGVQYDLVESVTHLVNPILVGESGTRSVSVQRTRILSSIVMDLLNKGYEYGFLKRNKYLIRDRFEVTVGQDDQLSMKRASPYVEKAKSVLIDIANNDPHRRIVLSDLSRRFGMSKKFFTTAKRELKNEGYVFNDKGSIYALAIDLKEEILANGGNMPSYRYLTKKFRTNSRRIKRAYEHLLEKDPDIFV